MIQNEPKNNKDMTINELIERAHSQAKAMGWWDEERNTGGASHAHRK